MDDAGRAARRAVLLVCAMLVLNYTGADGLIRWQWPVVNWQMYRAKARTEPVVRYERLVAKRRDGASERTSDCGTLPFIAHPYRLGSFLRQDKVGMLSACLRELRRGDPEVVSVALETRSWPYAERTLEEHLRAPPEREFRVVVVPPVPAHSRAPEAPRSAVSNGGFEVLDAKSGVPRTWSIASPALGIGLEAEGPGRVLVLGRARGPRQRRKPVQAEQSLELAPASNPTRLSFTALALATREGGSVTLDLPGAEQQKLEVPPDGAWHRLEATVERPPRAAATKAVVRLGNASTADLLVDDVRLTELPAGVTSSR